MTTSAVNPVTSLTTNTPATPVKAAGIDGLATENTFLQLLVAQLKNQDPLNPQDGTQFVAQLAQFSGLEQNIQMRQDLDAIKTAVQTPAPSNPITPTT
jgi:flagellar basal-body rod modification protein FlgD